MGRVGSSAGALGGRALGGLVAALRGVARGVSRRDGDCCAIVGGRGWGRELPGECLWREVSPGTDVAIEPEREYHILLDAKNS